jgi:hypothetical protein
VAMLDAPGVTVSQIAADLGSRLLTAALA